MPPTKEESIVWSGSLKVQNVTIKKTVLHTHHTCTNRPRGLDEFVVNDLISYSNAMEYTPLENLLNEEKIGLLLRQYEVTVEKKDRINCYVQYFLATSEETELFDELCTLMRRESVVSCSAVYSNSV